MVRASRVIATLCVLVATALTSAEAFADTVSWNAAVSGNWNDGTKWSTSNPPQMGDDVVITVAGTYTVTMNVDAVINSLSLGGSSGVQKLQVGNRLLTLSGPNASTVGANGVLGAGNVAGAGNLTVAGTLDWGNGTISGAGGLTVNGSLLLSSASGKILNGRTLVSNGSAQWQGGGPITLTNGAVLHNTASGTFDMQVGAFMGLSGAPSTERFDNDGALMKSGGGATTLDVPVDTSTGVSVNAGTLIVSRGGSWTGTLTGVAGTVLRFNGGTHSLSGVTIGGAGRTEIAGGTVDATGAVSVAATATLVHSATLTGAGALTVNGTLEWIAGTISGAGTFVVNGPLLIDSASSKTLSGRTLVSNGSAQWQDGGTINLNSGAVLHNTASGTFDMQSNGFMGITGAPTTELFDNDGVLMKSGGGTTTLNVPLDTTTGLSVSNGIVIATRGGTWTGQLNVAPGSTLRFNGATHNLSAVTIAGGGRTEVSGGIVNTAGAVEVAAPATLAVGATLGGAGALTVNGTLEWNAGTITGGGMCVVNGTVIMDTSSTKTLSGRTLDVTGTAQWKSSGTLSLSNAALLHNAATGTFDMQGNAFMSISGSPTSELFKNDGVLVKSGGGGTTTLNVPVDTATGVSVESGILIATRGGTWSGELSAVAGTTLRFNGGTHSLSAATITGPGRAEVSGGIVNTIGAVNVSDMTTLAVTATLGGGGALTVDGKLEWTAGTITGGGMCVINGMLTIDSSSTKTLSGRTIDVHGTAQWKSTGTLNLSSAGVLHNAATGSFDIQGDAFMGIAGAQTTEAFANDGALMKSGAGGTTTLNVPVRNSGTVAISSGSIAFTRAAYVQTAGSTTLNGGNMTAQVGVGMDMQGGSLRGSGTVTGHVSNGGTVAAGLSPGKLTITGNYTQTAAGALAVEIGGLTPATEFDQLQVNGTATLGGALNVSLINGFVPANGNQFIVLSGTTTGNFGTTNFPPLPGGLMWQVTVGSVTLTVGTGGPTATITVPVSFTPTSTATTTGTSTVSATPSRTVTQTATSTGLPTATVTRTSTSTPTLTPTATATSTSTPTTSHSPTATATAIGTPTVTVTGNATATNTLSPSPTHTATQTATLTATATHSQTRTPTATATLGDTPTPTITGAPGEFLVTGMLLAPGPPGTAGNGLVPIVGEDVDLLPPCQTAAMCLSTLSPAMTTVQTDDQGVFTFRLTVDIVRQGLFVVIKATVNGTRCRLLLTPTKLAALAAAQGVAIAGVGTDELRVDPIIEASSRVLESAGADNFDDAGIAAVIAAVEAANADSHFDGLSVPAANNLAETTAENDPNVQMVIAESRFCAGDCNHNRVVTIDELIRGVNIALARADVSICPAFDRDSSHTVTINELITAVNAALSGCP